MADITPTPADFRLPAQNVGGLNQAAAAENMVAFDVAYQHADGLKKASSATAATARVAGIIAVPSTNGGKTAVVPSGGYIESAADLWEPGTIYVLSGTAGKMCPVADLGADDFVSIVGIAETARRFRVSILNSGVQIVS